MRDTRERLTAQIRIVIDLLEQTHSHEINAKKGMAAEIHKRFVCALNVLENGNGMGTLQMIGDIHGVTRAYCDAYIDFTSPLVYALSDAEILSEVMTTVLIVWKVNFPMSEKQRLIEQIGVVIDLLEQIHPAEIKDKTHTIELLYRRYVTALDILENNKDTCMIRIYGGSRAYADCREHNDTVGNAVYKAERLFTDWGDSPK